MYGCELYDKKYIRMSSLNRHEKQKHDSDKQLYICT